MSSVLFCLGQRYSSRGSGLNQSDLLLSGGSVGQLSAGGGVYLPDYSVRQLTDLQIIKVANRNSCTYNTDTWKTWTAVIMNSLSAQFPAQFRGQGVKKRKREQKQNSCEFKLPPFNIRNSRKMQTLPRLQRLPLICRNPWFWLNTDILPLALSSPYILFPLITGDNCAPFQLWIC